MTFWPYVQMLRFWSEDGLDVLVGSLGNPDVRDMSFVDLDG